MGAMPTTVTLVEVCPLKAAWLMWQPSQGAPVLTVIVKASYELQPGKTPLAEVQDDVNGRDLHSENNPKLGLHSATDMVPYKPRADVTVVGRAFAPPNELARSVVARVQVGSVDKKIEVCGERYINRRGQLRAEAHFSKMHIGYERAAGGPDSVNPVGLNLSAEPDDKGRVYLPNIQVVGQVIGGRGSEMKPTGFGPISSNWPTRRALLRAKLSDSWTGDRWLDERFPEDWNWSYFNVGPMDQQLDEIHCDEKILIEHLHPDEAKLEMQLPGIRPVVFLEHRNNAEVVPVRGDTLWIDTNRLKQTVTWRGQISLADVDEEVRVFVAMADPGAELSWEDVWAKAQQKPGVTVSELPPSSGARDAKTQVHIKKGQPIPASVRFTSPVPLVPSSDHSPEWLPAPVSSSPPVASSASPAPPSVGPAAAGSAPAGSVELPVSLSTLDVAMLDKLAGDQELTPSELIRKLLRDAHAARFGNDEG
jgi:hypothetical protein